MVPSCSMPCWAMQIKLRAWTRWHPEWAGSFADCAYWAEVRQRFEDAAGVCWDEAVSSSMRQAHIRRFLGTLLAPPMRFGRCSSKVTASTL